MMAFARTPVVPKATAVRAVSAEAVRKLGESIHTGFGERDYLRFFSLCEATDLEKWGRAGPCQSFRTACAQLRHRLSASKRLI
jgi:hypothetical protein